jgi:hypothetical protein
LSCCFVVFLSCVVFVLQRSLWLLEIKVNEKGVTLSRVGAKPKTG